MKLLLLSSLLVIQLFGKSYTEFASKMNYEINYETALKKAQKEKKDIMVLVVANFCPWCQKLEKLVLSKDKYNKPIHDKYIPLILNREEGKFPKKFETPFIPTVYFVDYKTGKIKKKVIGYNNRQDLKNEILKP